MAVDLQTMDLGTGAPLVLLHAFPLSSAMWLDQHGELAKACRVVAPDLRGFGGSQLGDAEPSLDAMADDVAALLDVRRIDRAVIGGVSMGGYVTMALLRRHRDRVAGVVLVDTKATPDPGPARERRERIAARAEAGDDAVLIEEVLPDLVGETTKRDRAEVYGRVRELVRAAPGPAVAWAQRAMARRPDSFDTLRAFDGPALVVVGEEDVLSSDADAKAMTDALTQARLVSIREAGHLPPLERPAEFNRVVTGFMGAIGERC